MPRGVSGSDADSQALCQRSVYRQTEYSIAAVLQLEARPNGNSLGCPSTGLVEGEKLCIPPILSNNAITGKIEGTGGRADISCPIVSSYILFFVLGGV